MLSIQKNIKLANYSTFKIGGEARELVIVKDEKEIIEALDHARENDLKLFILGGGSNVVFNDEGFNGLIIKMHTSYFIIHDSYIECGAGLQLSEAVSIARGNSLSGFEWAAGIPGTVGGAVRGNAGAFRMDMSNVISGVSVLDIGDKNTNHKSQITNKAQNPKSKIKNKLQVADYKLQDCRFGYRDSIFKHNPNLIIISTKFMLEKGNKKEIEDKTRDIIKKRSEKQPKGWHGCAGSFFKNPVVDNEELRKRLSAKGGPASGWEREMKNEILQKRIPAGWLIEEVGLKGKKIGRVMVSEKNGNFIINTGGGTAKEIVMLASIIKQKIRNELGIQLEEEVKYVI